jgi:hypothetical protein
MLLNEMRLTRDEVRCYEEEGLVIPNYRLPEDKVIQLRNALDDIIASNPDVNPDLFRNPVLPYREGSVFGIRGGGWPFMEVAALPEILNMVEQLLGPDLILWGSQVFAKPAKTGMEVPWHQDSHFWQMRPLVACSVWIAIDDVTIENGCMRYIPGSHKHGLLSHYVEGRADVAVGDAVQPHLVNSEAAKDDVLIAGQFSIHHSDLIHGSMPNRSTKRRSGLVFRYMPATSHYDRDFVPPGASRTNTAQVDNKRQPIWLVRGENRHTGNDLKIGHEQFRDIDGLVERARSQARSH